MPTLDAIMLIEGGEASMEEVIEAVQTLIDDGIIWKLQGSYARLAIRMIEAGYCQPAE